MSLSSRPTPAPSAVIRSLISCEESILSKRAFSTLRNLPAQRQDRLVLAIPALLSPSPPAESPSTTNSSENTGSRS
jgi:hypothetical protein